MSKKVKKEKKEKKLSVFDGAQTGTVLAPKNTITIYQLGNCDRGIFPSAKELASFKKLIEQITSGKKNALFVAEGLVKVTQLPLYKV